MLSYILDSMEEREIYNAEIIGSFMQLYMKNVVNIKTQVRMARIPLKLDQKQY